MRQDKVKQIICISEGSAELFEERMNDALMRLDNPEIEIDKNRTFTAYIIYTVKRNMPEDVLELFEMVDGESHSCGDCPFFVPSTDKRKKWGECSKSVLPKRCDNRACEQFYLFRYKALSEAQQQYNLIPFEV